MSEINLGDEVRDVINGFEGIATARIEHLFRGSEIRIDRRDLSQDGRPFEPVWAEETRLEKVQRKNARPSAPGYGTATL